MHMSPILAAAPSRDTYRAQWRARAALSRRDHRAHGAGSKPQDLAPSRKSSFLFALTPETGTLDSFRVNANGSLSHITKVQGIPASAQGLVAR